MTHYIPTRYVETLWTYKGKKIKTVCVPGGGYTGGRSYRAYSEGGGSSYTGGGYTGDGSYSGYSGDNAQGYSGEGSYRGHSGDYGAVYGGAYGAVYGRGYSV